MWRRWAGCSTVGFRDRKCTVANGDESRSSNPQLRGWRWFKTHKIPPRMHQNSPFPDQKTKHFWGGGTAPSPDPSPAGEGAPHPHTPPPSAPQASRSAVTPLLFPNSSTDNNSNNNNKVLAPNKVYITHRQKELKHSAVVKTQLQTWRKSRKYKVNNVSNAHAQ